MHLAYYIELEVRVAFSRMREGPAKRRLKTSPWVLTYFPISLGTMSSRNSPTESARMPNQRCIPGHSPKYLCRPRYKGTKAWVGIAWEGLGWLAESDFLARMNVECTTWRAGQ